MKKSLALVNSIFVLGVLLSSYLLYTGVAPIVEGKVRVEMQDENDIKWEISNSTISADTFVRIINGGNYDINDVSLDIWVRENSTGYEIAEFKDTISLVPAGTVYTEPIHISVDVNEIPSNFKNRLINESANLTVIGEISAHSIGGLGEIKVHYRNVIRWEPLLKSLEIYTDDAQISYDSSKESMEISVPYFISTSSLLSGYAEAVVTVYNNSEVLSSNTERIPLGEDYGSYLNFNISSGDTYYLMTHSSTLPIEVKVRTESGFEFSRSYEYDWGAPFDGLYIGNLYSQINTAYVDYSFTNNYTRILDLSIEITAYDSSGAEVGHSYDYYTVSVGQHVERTASVSVTSYPSYAIVRITESVSGWSYELRRDA